MTDDPQVNLTSPPTAESVWTVKPNDPGLWNVALVNPDATVARWHTVTFTSEQAAQDAADTLNDEEAL